MGSSYIAVRRGKRNCRGYALYEVDDDVAARLAGTRWNECKGYAQRTVACKVQLLHRLIVCAEPSQEVHHRNGIKSDNRRENLKICKNHFEHHQEHNPRGCYLRKQTGKWSAEIRVAGKRVRLGCFGTETEARTCYERAAEALLKD